MPGDTFQAVMVGADPEASTLLSGAGELLAVAFSSLAFRETAGSLSVGPLEQSDWQSPCSPCCSVPCSAVLCWHHRCLALSSVSSGINGPTKRRKLSTRGVAKVASNEQGSQD